MKISFSIWPQMTERSIRFWTVKSEAYNNFNSDGNIFLAPNGTNNYYGAHLPLQVQVADFNFFSS